MKPFLLLPAFCSLLSAAGLVCDPDTDCFYVPARLAAARAPALLLLMCNGAVQADIDSFRFVADSLGWVMATCHRTRNHVDVEVNDAAIVRTTGKLLGGFPADSRRVYLFGYSGQGVQALASMFLHPDLFRGVAAVCAHAGGNELAVWEELAGHQVHLVTRTEDWNRTANDRMLAEFRSHGLAARLVMTPGKHDAGPRAELHQAARWLDTSYAK